MSEPVPEPLNPNPKQLTYVRRLLKWLAGLALLGIIGIFVLLAALRIDHETAVTLPTPTGPLPVGRAIYDWTDDQTFDALAPLPGTKREVSVWIWYPAETGKAALVDDYMPVALRTAIERWTGPLMTKFLTRDLSKVRPHALHNAEVSPELRSYPVVIMRAGASLEVVNYTSLAEDLASHGYIVVGIDAPYRTGVVAFPDGRVLERRPENNPELCLEKTGREQTACTNKILTAWTADIGFVIDRLTVLNASGESGKFVGRLDMTRVGIFGHSFGGAQAAQFCSEDSRCKAGIDIDGAPVGSVIQSGIHQPFMFLLSAQVESSDAESMQVKADIGAIYDRLPPDGRLLVEIAGANHFTFNDDGALLKSGIVLRALRLLGVLGIKGDRQLAVTSFCLHSFFDVYLKGEGIRPLKITSPQYPEIKILN
jgi:predicted dienelactone hydrolase